jgi:putative chitobiose transport system substrate-binding protein
VSIKRFGPLMTLTLLVSLLLAACGGGTATPDTGTQGSVAPSVAASAAGDAETSAAPSIAASTESSAAASPAGSAPAGGTSEQAVIPNVEPGAEITFWTYFLSPTFDEYIQDTIARFNEVYPDVTVNWEDRQATLQDEYRNSLAAGNAPDVVNLSTRWVPEFAQNDQLINMSEALPAEVREQYFPSLFEQVQVDGQSYQVPWYQAVSIYAINTELIEQAGLTVEDMPADYDQLREVCQTLKDQANTQCGLRLNADNLLSDMAYQGGVQVMNEDGTEFTFNSPEGVAWLQYWADMVKNDLTARDLILAAEDRPGLERFSAGQLPFYATGPQLIRIIKENNPDLYPKLAISPVAVGRSGAVPPSSMSIAVSAQTEYPNASLALATFFTNPESMTEFAKLVPVFPSTPASYDDPFFSEPGELIEDQPRAIAREVIGQQADILPEIPNAREVNEVVRQAVEQALFSDVTPEQALQGAVEQANALIE